MSTSQALGISSSPIIDMVRQVAQPKLSCKLRQHWMAEPGTLADLTHDARAAELAAAYLDAQRRETLASDEKESCKAELLQIIGDREKAICPGGTKISAAYDLCNKKIGRAHV